MALARHDHSGELEEMRENTNATEYLTRSAGYCAPEEIRYEDLGERPWVYRDGKPYRPATELEEAQYLQLLEYQRKELTRKRAK